MELTIDHVSKLYKNDVWGLRNIHLSLHQGIIGLLGPNGAGKSTLMRILATITQATEGNVRWNGIDIAKHPDPLRAVLGYLPQDFGVYPHLNAVEFLQYMAALKGVDRKSTPKRIDELLQVVNLVEARKRPLGGYSGGMRQRIGIAWEWIVSSEMLPQVRHHYLVSNTLRRTDGVHVRLVAPEPPDATARSTTPNLEDAYLYFISKRTLATGFEKNEQGASLKGRVMRHRRTALNEKEIGRLCW